MKLTWYDRLYLGKKAQKKRSRIIRGIRKSKPQSGIYVITPASNGNNILDIYLAADLSSAFYKDKEFHIVGIGADYWEALEVAGRIVNDMYRKTGDFDLPAFLKGRSNAPMV